MHNAKTESYVIEKDVVVCPLMSSSSSASTLCDLCREGTAGDCTCLHHYHSCFEPPGWFEVRGWKGHQGEWATEPHSAASVNITTEVKKLQRMLKDEIKVWKKRRGKTKSQTGLKSLSTKIKGCRQMSWTCSCSSTESNMSCLLSLMSCVVALPQSVALLAKLSTCYF